jgi:hypothetical protein
VDATAREVATRAWRVLVEAVVCVGIVVAAWLLAVEIAGPGWWRIAVEMYRGPRIGSARWSTSAATGRASSSRNRGCRRWSRRETR